MKTINFLRFGMLTLMLCCGFLAANAQAPSQGKATGDDVKLNQLQAGAQNAEMPGLIYPNTGNPQADAAQYELNKQTWIQANDPNATVRTPNVENVNMTQEQKAVWIQEHATEYYGNTAEGARTISRAEFNALPAEKKAAMQNDGYVIIESNK